MIVQHQPPLHLTYCLNIHPGETWGSNLATIEGKTARLRQMVAPGQWFGLGLRLSAQATQELARDRGLRHAALDVFAEHQFYPFSVNAFPYGQFHGTQVKENVYAPDWRWGQRRDYTFRAADILAGWLPEGVDGSISTVPGSYKGWALDSVDVAMMTENLAATVAYLAALHADTGKEIHLGLEPEPSCFLETTEETVKFFKDTLWTRGVERLRRIRQCGVEDAERLMRRHLGVCFDTCHVALQFEDPVAALRTYLAEGIRISKVQISAALMTGGSPEDWAALKPFAEGVYLHQVKGRLSDGTIRSWTDLPVALEDLAGRSGVEEARVHFHVPLFFERNGPLASTVSTLSPDFFRELRRGATSHLEIETYTFDVLPDDLHPGPMVKSISREYAWVLEHL